jgi:hypothetical protein
MDKRPVAAHLSRIESFPESIGMRHALLAAACAAGLSVLAGCAQTQTAFTPPPVPPVQVEVIPKPPVTATPLIWQPGHWNWNGTGYVWEPGQYVPRDGHGDMYMPGYWAQTQAGWAWQPPHWM